MTDYLEIWNRFNVLMVLPDEDRKTLVENLHEETRAGIEMLASLAASEMAELLKNTEFSKKYEYLKAAGPILSFACLNGYCLYLLFQKVNPLTTNLSNRATTEKLGETWMTNYRKDQNKSYIDKIDPILSLMLGQIQEIRVNQLLALVPDVIELPYKITERLHQSIGWSVFQGFVIGVMEIQDSPLV